MEKYGKERQAADDCIIRDIRFACWLTKNTDTYSEYVVLNCFSTTAVVTRTRLIVTDTYVASTVSS